MKRLLFLFTIALMSSLTFAQGPVVKGERPPIDLNNVPVEAYEPGMVQIKLKPTLEKSVPDVLMTAEKSGYVVTGIGSLDKLNQTYGASVYKPLLHGMYEVSPKSAEFRERHKAWGFHLWFVVEVDSKADVKEMVKEYSKLDEVEIAEPVYKKRLISNVIPDDKNNDREEEATKETKWTPNDPRYNEQWHYHNTGQQGGTVDKDIDLPEAWDIERGLSSVIVAVVDGGIQTNHPDLAGSMWSGKGYNFVTNSSTLQAHDHGTHVAGTVAAVNNNGTGVAGVAGGTGSNDGVRLMSCQVFTNTSSGGFNQAPIYAADNGAAISQNSWGYTSVNVYDQATLDAIDYFNANGGGNVLNGGITIFAAGNDNKTGNWYPGCYSGAFAVAATNNKDVRSYYSNYGAWVDISAPGGEQSSSTDPKGVLSTLTNNNYGFYQGTSMACPHVSGVAALLVSNAVRNGVILTNTQVASLLKNNVDNHYALNPSYTGMLGSGRLNAQKALVALQGMFTTNPPSTPTGLNSSNVTSSSATLSWSATSGATSYDVQIRPQGGSWNTYTVTSNSYNASNLASSTTYEWQVRAKNSAGTSSYSSIASFTTQQYVASYCTSKGNNSSYEWISKVVVGSFTNTSGAAGYTDFTSKEITLEAGKAYSISLTPGFASSTYNEYWKIWIDLNGNATFDAADLMFDAGSLSKTTVTGTITIPAGTAPRTTRMRVSMKYNAAQTACETFSYGEVEDYTVKIVAAQANPPATPTGLTASNITTSSASLSWNASTGATSYDVQLRQQGGSWSTSNVTTTTANATGLTAGTTYEWQVRANNQNGSSAYSAISSFTTQSTSLTYCTSKGNNANYEWIQRVQFAEVNNTSGKNGGYADFTSMTATVARGETLPIYIQAGFSGSSYTEYWSIWIDFNQNGTFDSDERVVYGSSSSSNLLSASVTIPTGAALGTTRMRVSMKYNAAQTACETFSYGEVEDYTVNVVQTKTSTLTTEPFADDLGVETNEIYTVYPNPASDMITVSLNGIRGDVSLKIYDVQGRLVKDEFLYNLDTQIDVSDLAKGVYIISVDEEKMPINKRFVKM
ncbi:MAG: S8 family serine peptidase [Tenuifilaceae bacterium]|nr:S8 family serine peptidase [Tenuifilaceae bacterium]